MYSSRTDRLYDLLVFLCPQSLLEKKRKQEREKEQREKEDTEQLLAEMRADDEKTSQEQIARANKLMLYRKGLIRDFHAAMAYSKVTKIYGLLYVL